MFGNVVFSRTRHELGTPPICYHLRREYPEFDGKHKPELFTYRHKRTGNWVVALWMNRARGVFAELLIIGPDPGKFSKDQRYLLRRLLTQPQDPRALASQLRAMDYEQERRLRLEGEESVESVRRAYQTERRAWPGWTPGS